MTLPTVAAERKAIPIATGFLDYFPLSAAAVATLSRIGNDQHNPGKPLHWDRAKSTDEADCLMRHFLERGTIDSDGVRHSTKVAWRALALLEKELEAARGCVGAVSDFFDKVHVRRDDLPPMQEQRLQDATAQRLAHNADPTTRHGGQPVQEQSNPANIRTWPTSMRDVAREMRDEFPDCFKS